MIMPSSAYSSKPKWLILGASGLLGCAVMDYLKAKKANVIGLARKDCDITADISDPDMLRVILAKTNPDIVFNCAAMADIGQCEQRAAQAFAINAAPLEVLAEWSQLGKRPFIHVSTDQFFIEGGNQPHNEDEPVSFPNIYAKTKFAGEVFALKSPHALVLRTNLIGAQKAFGRWALDKISGLQPMTLFTDHYCSSLHVADFAKYATGMIEKGARGRYNLASSQVSSKAEQIEKIADQIGVTLGQVKYGSAIDLKPRRALSLGLDVRRAEQALGYKLPDLSKTIDKLLADDFASRFRPLKETAHAI